jgi:membrane fusion protein (multidrug efflux system)
MKRLHVALILIAPSIFFSCDDKKTEISTVVPEVNVVQVGQKNVTIYTEYVGQAYGQSDIEIKPRVEGWIQSMHFKEGTPVRAGQLLYVIQDDELRDREQAARADLAQANVILAKDKADLDRVRPLTEMNALSKRDLDAAQATYDAQLQAIEAAKAALRNAQTQLSYSKVTAPISGIIGISKVQVGDYVRKTVGEQGINTISALGEIRVRFAITESDYIRFRQEKTAQELKNLPVEFVLNDGTIFPEKGRMDFANREIDPATGSLLVQAVVPNRSQLLRPGQYVKVRFKSNEIPNAIVVPQEAINQMQNVYMAFVVNDSNKVNPKPVQVGTRTGSNWVVTQGLSAGDKVALVGNALIKPGTVVKPIIKSYSYDSTMAK